MGLFRILLFVATVWVCWKLLVWGVKAAWGAARIVCTVVLFPLAVVALILAGLLYLAVPILVVAGIVAMICSKSS